MQCLYCGAKLGALSSKEFCNKKHQELFREQEAQLSIQRLKEAFSFAGSPTSKSRAGTSVLDSPSSEIPPDPEFTSQDPHGRLLEAPASRTRPEPPRPETPRPETPPANPNVIYCGPASEQRDTPPNAGFVTADEPKATFRLPFYVRRPEAGETAVEAGVADLVPQVVGEAEGRTGFGPVACLTSGRYLHRRPARTFGPQAVAGVALRTTAQADRRSDPKARISCCGRSRRGARGGTHREKPRDSGGDESGERGTTDRGGSRANARTAAPGSSAARS